MLIKIKKDGTPLIEIARTIGAAPCQILAVNNVRTETELENIEYITVPIVLEKLVKG